MRKTHNSSAEIIISPAEMREALIILYGEVSFKRNLGEQIPSFASKKMKAEAKKEDFERDLVSALKGGPEATFRSSNQGKVLSRSARKALLLLLQYFDLTNGGCPVEQMTGICPIELWKTVFAKTAVK